MIVASLNAKKRLGAEGARARFRSWLERRGVTLVLVQEAWRVGAPAPPRLPGMKLLGGDHELAVWVREGAGRLVLERPAEWWQTVLADERLIHSLHLDPYSGAMRVEQLQTLAEQLPVGPNLVLGDFNLASRSVDGMYGTSVSEFTTTRERHALAELLEDRCLLDAMASDRPEFTVSRRVPGADSSFRCDLALLPASLATHKVVVDHETRLGPDAFTDRSGVVVSVGHTTKPPTCRSMEPSDGGRQRLSHAGGRRADPTIAESFKTAIARGGPSAPARALTPFIERLLAGIPRDPSMRSVLDYGCGRGADVDYYRELRIDADGYDPHAPFGFAEPPSALFRVVTLVFVLDVLPTIETRLEAIRDAVSHLAPEGVLIVVTRSAATVRNQASRRNWRAWGDGFISHEDRGTFQHGMDTPEIVGLGEMLNLRSYAPLPPVRDASTLALARRAPTEAALQSTRSAGDHAGRVGGRTDHRIDRRRLTRPHERFGDQTHIRPRVVLAATSSSLVTPALLLRQGRRHATQPNAGFRSGRSGEVSLSTLNDRAETAAARPKRYEALAGIQLAAAPPLATNEIQGNPVTASF